MMLSWNISLLIYYKWSFHFAVEDGDNSWGFGQTMPLALLILPAMTIVEEYLSRLKTLLFPPTHQTQTYFIRLLTDWDGNRQEGRF